MADLDALLADLDEAEANDSDRVFAGEADYSDDLSDSEDELSPVRESGDGDLHCVFIALGA